MHTWVRLSACACACVSTCVRACQCRINNGANGAAAPGPPQLGAPHKGFFVCTLIFLHTRSQTGLQRPPDPQLYCTLPPAALVWDTGAPILREKSPPLKFCTRPPTLVIRHWCVRAHTCTGRAHIIYEVRSTCRLVTSRAFDVFCRAEKCRQNGQVA